MILSYGIWRLDADDPSQQNKMNQDRIPWSLDAGGDEDKLKTWMK